ncbi:MAG: KTSC domain-containing protein [Ferruginibacter sp.]
MPSSVILHTKYFPSTAVLRVIFVSGSIYDYKAVPEKVYKEMIGSASKGIYLNKNIKGHYDFEKIKDGSSPS